MMIVPPAIIKTCRSRQWFIPSITKTRRSPMMPSLKTNLAGRASKSNRDSRTSSEPTQNARIKTSAIFFIARTTRRQTGKRCGAPAS